MCRKPKDNQDMVWERPIIVDFAIARSDFCPKNGPFFLSPQVSFFSVPTYTLGQESGNTVHTITTVTNDQVFYGARGASVLKDSDRGRGEPVDQSREREREREREGTRFREISIMPSPPNLSTYHIGLSIVEDCHMVQVMYVGDQQMKKKVDSAVQGLAGLRPCLMHCITNTVHTYPRKHENFLSFSRGLTIKSK